MSVPFGVVECELCGYVATTSVTNGKFLWTDGEDEFWFSRRLAVCHSCESVVAMEEFPTEPEIQEKEQNAQEAARRRERSTGFFARLFRSRSTIDPNSFPRMPEGFDVARKVLAMGRKPVCLSCGSTTVVPLVLPDDYVTSNESLRMLNVRHPGCGGMLTIYGSGGTREMGMPIARIYNLEGRFIGERHEWR
jgi:hypothetical protein